MRITLLFLILFQSVLINAQNRGGIRNSSPGNQRTATAPVKMPEYDPAKTAGIMEYDIKAVLKKLKLKKNPNSVIVKKAIEDHNREMNALNLLHTGIFDELKMLVALTINQAVATKDYSGMKNLQKQLNTTLEPIREKVTVSDSSLNEKLRKELSEGQFKKWVKYQKQQRSKNKVRAPNQTQGTKNKKQKGKNRY